MKRRAGAARRNVGETSTGAIFGRNLRRSCRSKGLTAEMVAKRTGYPRSTVQRLLGGELVPGLAVLRHLARKLDTPLSELVRDL